MHAISTQQQQYFRPMWSNSAMQYETNWGKIHFHSSESCILPWNLLLHDTANWQHTLILSILVGGGGGGGEGLDFPPRILFFEAPCRYPLLVKDGLALPCWALCGLFYICSRLLLRGQKTHWALRALVGQHLTTPSQWAEPNMPA